MLDESDSMISCPYNKSHMIQRSRMQTHLKKCTWANQHPQQNVEPLHMKICRYNSNHHVPANEIHEHEDNCPDIGNLASFVFSTGKGSCIPYKPIKLPPTDENWDEEEYNSTYNPEEKAMREPVLRAAQGVPKAERKNFRHRERERITRLREQETVAITKGHGNVNPRPQPVVTVEKHAFTEAALRHPKGPAASLLGMGRGSGVVNYQAGQDFPRPGIGRALTSKGMSNMAIGNVPSVKPLLANTVGTVRPVKPRQENEAQSSSKNAAAAASSPEKKSVEDTDGFTKVGKKKKGHSATSAGNFGPVATSPSPLHPYGVPIPDSFSKILAPSRQGKGRGRLTRNEM